MVLAGANIAGMFKNPFLDFCFICHQTEQKNLKDLV